MSPRAEIRIASHGEELAAYFYRPDTRSTAPVPCVVMAHGFSGTRDDGLPGYAESFCGAGFAVILFDYRYFGGSTGEPRQLLDIGCQQDDYRAVIAYARETADIDPDRIVLWGSSFSGGHVLVVAAGDPRIAAVISQAPFTDSLSVIRRMPVVNVIRATVAGIADRIGALVGRAPVYLPAVGPPGSFAALTAPDAQAGFGAILGPESLWRNEFAARLITGFIGFRPVAYAAELTMPVLFCVADKDAITPTESTIRAARAAPRGLLLRYPVGHFEIYDSPKVKADQVAFLRNSVPGMASPG